MQALDRPPKPNAALRRLMAGKARNVDDCRIERLERGHVREGFDCGKSSLNDFLHGLVSQYEKRNLGRTYVVIGEGARRVVGYYTLASGAIDATSLPAQHAKKLPRHPVPSFCSHGGSRSYPPGKRPGRRLTSRRPGPIA